MDEELDQTGLSKYLELCKKYRIDPDAEFIMVFLSNSTILKPAAPYTPQQWLPLIQFLISLAKAGRQPFTKFVFRNSSIGRLLFH
jgi:hypothetical protein